MEQKTTSEVTEVLRLIDAAAQALNQASAILRAESRGNLDQEQCDGLGKRNCRQLAGDVESLAENIRRSAVSA